MAFDLDSQSAPTPNTQPNTPPEPNTTPANAALPGAQAPASPNVPPASRSLIGKITHAPMAAMKALGGVINDQSVQYNVDPETGKTIAEPVKERPGAIFRNILAAAITGGAAAGAEHAAHPFSSPAQGFVTGAEAGFEQQQKQDTIKRQQAQQQFTNEEEVKKEKQQEIYQKAQIAHWNLQNLLTEQQMSQQNFDFATKVGILGQQQMLPFYMAGVQPQLMTGQEVMDRVKEDKTFATTHLTFLLPPTSTGMDPKTGKLMYEQHVAVIDDTKPITVTADMVARLKEHGLEKRYGSNLEQVLKPGMQLTPDKYLAIMNQENIYAKNMFAEESAMAAQPSEEQKVKLFNAKIAASNAETEASKARAQASKAEAGKDYAMADQYKEQAKLKQGQYDSFKVLGSAQDYVKKTQPNLTGSAKNDAVMREVIKQNPTAPQFLIPFFQEQQKMASEQLARDTKIDPSTYKQTDPEDAQVQLANMKQYGRYVRTLMSLSAEQQQKLQNPLPPPINLEPVSTTEIETEASPAAANSGLLRMATRAKRLGIIPGMDKKASKAVFDQINAQMTPIGRWNVIQNLPISDDAKMMIFKASVHSKANAPQAKMRFDLNGTVVAIPFDQVNQFLSDPLNSNAKPTQ